MSYVANLADGYLPNTVANEAAGIPQFRVVCVDTTSNPSTGPIKVVLPNNVNAGLVAGVNESSGMDANFVGGVGQPVALNQSCRVGCSRIMKVQAKSGETIAAFTKVYAAAADPGTITATSAGNKFVGTSMEASQGGTADLIAVNVHTLSGV